MTTPQVTTFKTSDTICSKVNVRPASKAKHIDELVSDISHHGQLQPVIIRIEDGKPAVIAGQRRRKALLKLEQANDDVQLEAYVVEVDDMQAIAISLSENKNQLPMTVMDSYKAFSKLAKQGWDADTISIVYSMSVKEVCQTLALGDLPASVVTAYEDENIGDDCLKLLAIAPKGRLNQWIKLYREGNAPTWARDVKSFIANDQDVIKTEVALFDLTEGDIALVDDIFQEESFFADPDQFWVLQRAEIESIQADYESRKWIVEVIESRYSSWQYSSTKKKDGGKVLIFVSSDGTVEVKEGILSNTELQQRARLALGEEDESQAPKVKPEVTKKLNEYLLGYLTQAAQSSVMDDYELTQRVMLVMLLCADGRFSTSYSDTQSRIANEVTNGELAKTEKYIESEKLSKSAFKKLGTKPNGYSRDFAKMFIKVMKLDLVDVQTALSVVTARAMTPHCDAVKAIHKHVKPDMTKFWNAESSPSFVQVAQGKPLLFSVLESLTDTQTVSEHEKAKVMDIKSLIQAQAVEQGNWLPAYFTGGSYGNGVGAPLS